MSNQTIVWLFIGVLGFGMLWTEQRVNELMRRIERLERNRDRR